MDVMKVFIASILTDLHMREWAIYWIAGIVGIILAGALSSISSGVCSPIIRHIDKAIILTPFILFALLYDPSSDYTRLLVNTTIDKNPIKWGAAGMIIGIWWMNKSLKLRYKLWMR